MVVTDIFRRQAWRVVVVFNDRILLSMEYETIENHASWRQPSVATENTRNCVSLNVLAETPGCVTATLSPSRHWENVGRAAPLVGLECLFNCVSIPFPV